MTQQLPQLCAKLSEGLRLLHEKCADLEFSAGRAEHLSSQCIELWDKVRTLFTFCPSMTRKKGSGSVFCLVQLSAVLLMSGMQDACRMP